MKICLVGHSAAGFRDGRVGGSERQSALLARELAGRGHDVAYVVHGLAEPDRIVRGVRLRSGWDPDAGVRYLRAVTYRYRRLLSVLREERAAVYYARGAGYYTPFVVRAAKDVGARSVLALASDRDLYTASGKVLFAVPSARVSAAIGPIAHAWFRRWGLRAADWIVVQNEEQAAACASLGLRHAVLPNVVEPPPEQLLVATATRDVFWAGNVIEGRRSKGFAELAGLAARLPEVSFSVAGTISGETSRPVKERLERLPNVELVGPLTHPETQRCMAEHRLVINTSPSEGFSNVMLEGWALGRPAVTLAVNPSGLLDGDRLGVCSGGDETAMAAAIVALLEEPAAREAMGRRCREYIADTHSAEAVCATFERLVG